MPKSTPACRSFLGVSSALKKNNQEKARYTKASARSSYKERKLSSILAAALQPQAVICMSRAPEALPCHLMHQGGRCGGPWWGRGELGEDVSEVPRSGQQEGGTCSWGHLRIQVIRDPRRSGMGWGAGKGNGRGGCGVSEKSGRERAAAPPRPVARPRLPLAQNPPARLQQRCPHPAAR